MTQYQSGNFFHDPDKHVSVTKNVLFSYFCIKIIFWVHIGSTSLRQLHRVAIKIFVCTNLDNIQLIRNCFLIFTLSRWYWLVFLSTVTGAVCRYSSMKQNTMKLKPQIKLFSTKKCRYFTYFLMKTFVVVLIGTVSMRRFKWVPTTYVIVEKQEY